MKRFAFCLMLLALLLSACSAEKSAPVLTVKYGDMTFTVDTEQGTITHGNDVYKIRYSQSGAFLTTDIIYPNGAQFYWTDTGSTGHSSNYDPERYVNGERLQHMLENAGITAESATGTSSSRQKKGSPLLGAVCIILGAVMFFFPDLFWQLKYGWAYKNAEPSQLALGAGMVSGVVIAVLGVVLFFI